MVLIEEDQSSILLLQIFRLALLFIFRDIFDDIKAALLIESLLHLNVLLLLYNFVFVACNKLIKNSVRLGYSVTDLTDFTIEDVVLALVDTSSIATVEPVLPLKCIRPIACIILEQAFS